MWEVLDALHLASLMISGAQVSRFFKIQRSSLMTSGASNISCQIENNQNKNKLTKNNAAKCFALHPTVLVISGDYVANDSNHTTKTMR
jgi:hypothetical protein